MTNTGKKIIFIVEDNEVYAKSLQTYIITRFQNVKEIKIFRIGELCLMEMERNPGIVIIDYRLDSKYSDAHDGLEIIKHIISRRPLTNIILLSAYEKNDAISESIQQYGYFYIQKDREAFSNVDMLIRKILDHNKSRSFEPWA